MFNFCGFAGRAMVTDAGRANFAGANSKHHDYKQKYKKRRTFRKGVSRKNRLKFSDEKNTSSLDRTTPSHTLPLNATIEDGPWNQEEINSRKNEKKKHSD